MGLSPVGQDQSLDIRAVLDDHPVSPVQVEAIILAATSIIFDGLGVQLIGYALPIIARQLGLSNSALAPAVTAGLIGMAAGSACAGALADRFGRRWALIASVMFFGVSTICVGLSDGITSVVVFRFLAGAGVGGAIPTSTTFVAEFTPARIRTVVVTCTIVCVPLGGMLAGLISGVVLPSHGWRALFFAGGVIPIAFGLVLFLRLDETPRFLARQPSRWPALRGLLFRMRYVTSPSTQFTDLVEKRLLMHVRFSSILTGKLQRETICLWIAFAACLFSIYMAFSWLPALLVAMGYTTAQASFGLAAYNGAGVAGSLLCSLAIVRYGSRPSLIFFGAGGTVLALTLVEPLINSRLASLVIAVAVLGFFANGVQSALYTLANFVYPTPIRARGTALAVAFGRCGAVLAGVVGAFVVASTGRRYFLLISSAMILVVGSLGMLRRHIPSSSGLAEDHNQ